MKTLTEAQARKAGYEICRGSYSGTSDDRIDRWYVDPIDSTVIDHTHEGFSTKRDALEALTRDILTAKEEATR